MVWITIPNQKAKKTWVLNSFSPTPPKAGVQKYLRPSPTSGGTFALPSSGGHLGPGINVLLLLFNFAAKITKSGSGTKIFKSKMLQRSSQCWGLQSAKVAQKTKNPTINPSTLGWSVQYLLFENCFSCIWDLSNSSGYKRISSIGKQFGGTLWIPWWNINVDLRFINPPWIKLTKLPN